VRGSLLCGVVGRHLALKLRLAVVVSRATLSQALPVDLAPPGPRADATTENPLVRDSRRASASSGPGVLGPGGATGAASAHGGVCVMCKKPLLTGSEATGAPFDVSMYCSQQCETFYGAMKHKGFDVRTVGTWGVVPG
jgi:hypothetical protein